MARRVESDGEGFSERQLESIWNALGRRPIVNPRFFWERDHEPQARDEVAAVRRYSDAMDERRRIAGETSDPAERIEAYIAYCDDQGVGDRARTIRDHVATEAD